MLCESPLMGKSLLLVCPDNLRAQLCLRLLNAAHLEAESIDKPENVESWLPAHPDVRVVFCDWRLNAIQAVEWVEVWRQTEAGKSLFYIITSDRLPSATESTILFERGISDVWLRPVPDYLIVPRLKVWLGLMREGELVAAVAAAERASSLASEGKWQSDVHSAPSAESPSPMQGSEGAGQPQMDAETEVLSKALFLDMSEGLFSGARRLGLYVGCMAVGVSQIEEVARLLGPQAKLDIMRFLASELRRIKRKEDFLGRWDETMFVLASYFPRSDAIQSFGRRLHESLQRARFPYAEQTGPLRFTISGAWGPSRDYALGHEILDAVVRQAHTLSEY